MTWLPRLTFVLFMLALPAAQAASGASLSEADYRVATISAVRQAPKGRIVAIWDKGTPVRADRVEGDWVRISARAAGEDDWQPLDPPLWIPRPYLHRETPPPPPADTAPKRYIVVDKSDYELRVIEEEGQQRQVLYRTDVAVGLDGCLPEEKGGRCYYTEPGEYKVRWKVYDPEGIEWCIPKFMEKEYADDIAAGRRCFRGVIGTHALNIGKSYAIHGTSKPQSIGTSSTHGCVRVANGPMEAIYRYMDVGDKVVIRE